MSPGLLVLFIALLLGMQAVTTDMYLPALPMLTASFGATVAATLARTWKNILLNPAFRAFSALSICSYGGLFTYLAASSFVYINVLGLSQTAYSLVLMASALTYIPGTFLCRRLLVQKHGASVTV